MFQAGIVFQDIKLPAVKIFISDIGKMIIKHPGKMPYLCYIYQVCREISLKVTLDS